MLFEPKQGIHSQSATQSQLVLTCKQKTCLFHSWCCRLYPGNGVEEIAVLFYALHIHIGFLESIIQQHTTVIKMNNNTERLTNNLCSFLIIVNPPDLVTRFDMLHQGIIEII